MDCSCIMHRHSIRRPAFWPFRSAVCHSRQEARESADEYLLFILSYNLDSMG